MLDAQFLYQTRGKDTRSEGATEDCTELGIQTSNAHVLEFESWLDDRIGGGALGRCFQFDVCSGILEEIDLGVSGEDAASSGVRRRRGVCILLLHGEICKLYRPYCHA